MIVVGCLANGCDVAGTKSKMLFKTRRRGELAEQFQLLL